MSTKDGSLRFCVIEYQALKLRAVHGALSSVYSRVTKWLRGILDALLPHKISAKRGERPQFSSKSPKDDVLMLITDSYLNSRDFNGLPTILIPRETGLDDGE